MEFEKQKPISEIAAYLPTLYHGGSGVGSVTAWYTEDSIHLSHGKFARYDRAAQLLSWKDAAERIGQLLEAGQFASNVELAEAESYERSLLADEFWSLYHDLSEEARNAGYLQSLSHIQGNGFPEESAWLTGQLANPAFRAALLDEYQQFLTAHQDNRALLRFHYHHLEGMLARLRDLDLPRKTFSTELAEVPSVKRFITEDEIDAALTSGSGMAGGKGRIFAFFQESHTDKEKVDFLKHEYGIGGRSHALSGAAGSDEWYDGKGLRFKKAGCPDVHLTWDKAAKRITGLIQQGRYLSAQEQAELEQRQEEADLAEADAMAAQQAELSIQDSLEQYKPIVRTALEADTAYRNACGHSDHENAVIEGNAAVRRAVLNSGDLELIRLYSDVPEFRHRLHGEVIDETYPHLHELLRPLSQDDIDDALRAWNGNADSKRAVIHYMEAHAREKDTAAWLAREFNGSDGKTLFAVRPDSPEGTALPWPKVQRRIAQLIQENKFLTEQERQPEENEQDARRYQVVVYHHFENGFDERLEYPTLEEAEKVAQGYVDGTMEPDGFAYDGAAIYDLEQRTYLRIIGNYPDEAAQAQVARLDLSGHPITREGDTLTIGSGEPTQEMDITVSDEEYEAIRQAIPETEAPTAYDPATPPYHVGDTVYLDNQEYQITELREDTVQLLPSNMA
ncbi:MAG TPA: helicase SNF2, partial [Candidatus Faecousia intestinigallinarum]|nr:helicase SNF2 [Candidatus Faecousia intestinigallinarum]